MADRVTESVDDTVHDKGSNSLQGEELSTFVGGRESTPDIPTSASVTAQVLEHPYIHTSSHLQSSTPMSTVPAPSFSVQFTPNPSTVQPHGENCRGEELTPVAVQQSREQLVTPEKVTERRTSETEAVCHGGTSGTVSEAEHSASNQSLPDGVISRTLDSAIHSSPIATPAPSSSLTTQQSLSKELGMSPYVVVKGGLVEVSQYESPGLLYARSTKESHNLDTLRPADEVAEDVLETIQDVSHKLNWTEDKDRDEGEREGERNGEEGEGEREREMSGRRKESYRKSHSIESRGQYEDLSLDLDISQSSIESPVEPMPPLDPTVLRDLERQSHKVATSLEHIMDNLRNSLYAMTVCTKQSVMLHREAVDNLHTVVDNNVKATYSFLAKFEELKRQTIPLNDLAQQIRDINETLKILERHFRTP